MTFFFYLAAAVAIAYYLPVIETKLEGWKFGL